MEFTHDQFVSHDSNIYIKTSGHTTVIKMRRKTINSFQLFLLVIVKNKEVDTRATQI